MAAPTTTTVTRLMKTGFRNENKRDYRVSSALPMCQTGRFIRLTCLKSAKDIIQPCEISFRIGARGMKEGTRTDDKFISAFVFIETVDR